MTAPTEAVPRAEEVARKALDLHESLVEAHTELAAEHFWYDYDWPAPEGPAGIAIST